MPNESRLFNTIAIEFNQPHHKPPGLRRAARSPRRAAGHPRRAARRPRRAARPATSCEESTTSCRTPTTSRQVPATSTRTDHTTSALASEPLPTLGQKAPQGAAKPASKALPAAAGNAILKMLPAVMLLYRTYIEHTPLIKLNNFVVRAAPLRFPDLLGHAPGQLGGGSYPKLWRSLGPGPALFGSTNCRDEPTVTRDRPY